MPIAYYGINYGEEAKPRYTYSTAPFGPHTPAWDITVEVFERALIRLKTISRELDEFHVLQKQCAREKNLSAARYYREMIQEWTKQQRAWRLVLGYFVDEKALPYRAMQYWPVELADHCDAVFRSLELLRAV